MSTTLIVLGLLLSAVIGFFLGRIHGMSHRSKELSETLEQKEQELDDLQGNVKEHFDETARLFSNLTEEYKGLYQHLAKGASNLSGKEFQLKISPSNIAGALDVNLSDEQVHEGEFENPDKPGAIQPVDYVRPNEEAEVDPEQEIEVEENLSKIEDSNDGKEQNNNKTQYATQETSQEHPPGQHSI